MLVLKKGIIDIPIMSLQTGAEIARTERPIIDPRQLVIVAFYCQGTGLDVSPAVLHVEDIREVSGLGFIVDSTDVIMSPADLVRLQQVIGFNFTLEGKTAVEESGRKIGKVVDYTIDTRSFYITQLQVQPSIIKAWNTADVLIGRTQIVEITDDKIIVRLPVVNDEVPVTHHASHHPFSHAQPEASGATHKG